MLDIHAFLQSLAVILCVAAATTVLFQKLRQPVVLGYLLAGMIVGPHLAIPLVADPKIAHVLSELGVILLMFSLGLEFSLRKLVRVGPTSGIVAVIQCSAMVWLGFAAGRLFGWTVLESVFAGAIIAISSTTIIVKAFEEQGIGGKRTELVFGILIIEDLIAIVLMAILTAVGTGAGLSAGEIAVTVGKLAAFLFGMVVIGLLVIPRAVRYVVALERNETTLVAAIGICFALALLAQSFGYSVALGAFLAGTLVAESGEGKRIEHLVQPVRDVFGAIFFVAVGMLIEPRLVAEHFGAVLAFTALVVAGKVVTVAFGAVLAGQSVRDSVRAGLSLAQIGEFSFILAEAARGLNLLPGEGHTVVVGAAIVSISLNPIVFRAVLRLEPWLEKSRLLGPYLTRGRDALGAKVNADELARPAGARAVVVGYGPVGRTVTRLLAEFGVEPVILETNVDTVLELHALGKRALFGDATNSLLLEEAGVANASHLVVTLPDPQTRTQVIAAALGINPKLRVLTRARFVREREALESVGATAICFDEAEAAVGLAEVLLADLSVPPERIAHEVERLRVELAGPVATAAA